jgi:hypothetical protein
MTTKLLSRTVIEGGRTGHYKAECHKRIRQERAAWRSQAQAIICDPEALDNDVPAKRVPVIPDFDDKLSPIYRFLESRVGRNWDAVRSELFEKFDTRTTPGRHVLFDHLLRDVAESPEPDPSRFGIRRFYRDANGILREEDYWKTNQWWPPQQKVVRVDLHAVARWLGSVKVGRAGKGFARYIAANGSNVRAVVERHALAYAFVTESGAALRKDVPPTTTSYSRVLHHEPTLVSTVRVPFRQDGMLDADEAAHMRSLPESVQKMICALAPANV